MSFPDFSIRNAETESDYARVKRLLGTEFEIRPGMGAVFQCLYDNVIKGWNREAISRIAVVKDKVVGHVLLAPRSFHFDGVAIPGGILAMVVVSPHFRGKGIGSALIADVEALAKRQGLLYMQLAGDRGFYGRMGYVEGYLDCRTHLGTGSGYPGCSGLRPVGPGDAGLLARLSSSGFPSGSVLPSVDRWQWMIDTGHPGPLTSTNETLLGIKPDTDYRMIHSEGTVGALWAGGNGERLVVYEAWPANGEGDHLLESILQFAHESGYKRVAFHLPPDHSLAHAALKRGGKQECGVDPTLLGKVLDAAGMLEHVFSTVPRRESAAKIGEFTGHLELKVDGEPVSFVFNNGIPVISGAGGGPGSWTVSMPGIALTRALLGTDRFTDRARAQIGRDEELRIILDALFPQKTPYFWLADSL